MGSAEQARIALNRFGLGARPGEVAAVARDPVGWLQGQVTRAGAPVIPAVAPSDARILAEEAFQKQRREQAARAIMAAAQGPATQGGAGAPMGGAGMAEGPALPRPYAVFAQDLRARLAAAATSDAPFAERLAMFWSNHLAVSVNKFAVIEVAVPYENEAIRPHIGGRFADMLKASSRHPAMLLFLDGAQSVGPNSPAGQRRHRSYNENYAREVMELHTVGVDGGYAQADIIQLALLLTGWTIDRRTGQAVWRGQIHEPGDRVVMHASFPAGADQADRALDFLATHPRTAERLSRRLAAHFVADDPPPALVAAMARVWCSSGGDLAQVYRAMLAHAAAWHPAPRKFKDPEGFVISAARALGLGGHDENLLKHLRALGQVPFNAASPQGYDDSARTWLTPDAVVERVNVAAALASLAPAGLDPPRLFAELTGADPHAHVAEEIARAPSQADGLALLLASPEFQRS